MNSPDKGRHPKIGFRVHRNHNSKNSKDCRIIRVYAANRGILNFVQNESSFFIYMHLLSLPGEKQAVTIPDSTTAMIDTTTD